MAALVQNDTGPAADFLRDLENLGARHLDAWLVRADVWQVGLPVSGLAPPAAIETFVWLPRTALQKTGSDLIARLPVRKLLRMNDRRWGALRTIEILGNSSHTRDARLRIVLLAWALTWMRRNVVNRSSLAPIARGLAASCGIAPSCPWPYQARDLLPISWEREPTMELARRPAAIAFLDLRKLFEDMVPARVVPVVGNPGGHSGSRVDAALARLRRPGVEDPISMDWACVAPEDLVDAVWERPLEDVAASYGVSRPVLAAFCRRAGIQTPPRSYWRMTSENRARAREEA